MLQGALVGALGGSDAVTQALALSRVGGLSPGIGRGPDTVSGLDRNVRDALRHGLSCHLGRGYNLGFILPRALQLTIIPKSG